MNIKGFRRMLFGEKMPDKNDPQYKERYERDVEAGRRFARATRIDKAAARVQRFADMHRTLFLAIVFGFVAAALGMEHLPSGGSVPPPVPNAHGYGDAGFGAAAAAQNPARGRHEGTRRGKGTVK